MFLLSILRKGNFNLKNVRRYLSTTVITGTLIFHFLEYYSMFDWRRARGWVFFMFLQGRKYELVATITHHGREPSKGHYTADARYPNGRWLRFDDASVFAIGTNQVLHDQAYVLFYRQLWKYSCCVKYQFPSRTWHKNTTPL